FKPFKNSYTNFRKSHLYDSLSKAGMWNKIRKKRIIKNTLSSFSFGANGYFIFGDLDNTTNVIYPSVVNYFNTKRIRNTRVSDFYSSYGLLFAIRLDSSMSKRRCEIKDTSAAGMHIEYRNDCPCRDTMAKATYESRFPKKFQKGRKKDFKITFGATAYLPTQLSANYSALGYTYKQYSPTVQFAYDTTLNVQKSGTITMPLVMNFGISFKKGLSHTLLTDVSIQNWSYYRFFGEDQKLKNSYRFSLGYQFVSKGKISTDKDVFKNLTFLRAGAYYNTGYLSLKNTLISEYGISLGTGIPMGKRVFSSLNISAEFGRWGTTQNNLVQNNFIRCTIGVTLNDKWFQKRVID
ncbi:MAG: hypothetical protein IAF38_21930, partial [Bacteroidia bacterium]|nr:hypothetical protein [Bacteroidia bacterium]